MAKAVKLEQLSTHITKLEDFVYNRDLDFGEVVDSQTTESHDKIDSLQRRLQKISDRLGERESTVASEAVSEMGTDLAEQIGDADSIAVLISLAKAGKLDSVLGKNEPKVETEPSAKTESAVHNDPVKSQEHDEKFRHDELNRRQNGSSLNAGQHS